MNRQLQDEILEALPQLNLRMVYKLGVHAAKGPWTNKSLSAAMDELVDEVEELREKVNNMTPYEEVADECADVGNMVLIISHIYSRIDPPPRPITLRRQENRCSYINSTGTGTCRLDIGHKDGHDFV